MWCLLLLPSSFPLPLPIAGIALIAAGVYVWYREYQRVNTIRSVAVDEEKTAAQALREQQTRATIASTTASSERSELEVAGRAALAEYEKKGEKDMDVIRRHVARAVLKAGAPTLAAAAAIAVSLTVDSAKQRPKPPTSKSELRKKLQEAVELFKEDRVIVALEVLKGCDAFLDGDHKSDDVECQKYIDANKEVIDMLRLRGGMAVKALGDFNLTEGWIVDSQAFDVTTSFRIGKGANGEQLLYTKLEAYFKDTPLFDTIAVINETDLFTRWMPMCSISSKLKQVGRSEQVLHFNIGHLIMTRDCVMNAYGIDAMEDRCTLIMGRSVDEYPGVTMPRVSGWGAQRMFMHELKFLIEPITDTEARVVQITCIDMKMDLPETVLQFILKKVAALQLIRLRREARLIQADGDSNPYRQAIKANPQFYKWLAGRVEETKKLFETELELIRKLESEGLEEKPHHQPKN